MTDYADLKAKAEAQLAKHHWAARRVKCCQKCRDAKEVLALLAENERLRDKLQFIAEGDWGQWDSAAEIASEVLHVHEWATIQQCQECPEWVYITSEQWDGYLSENARLQRELTEAQAFKAYVHDRLDEAGIPTHPDGPHSLAGCRVGDRLDIALTAEAQLAEMRAALEQVIRTRRTVYIGTPHIEYRLTLPFEAANKFEAALASTPDREMV